MTISSVLPAQLPVASTQLSPMAPLQKAAQMVAGGAGTGAHHVHVYTQMASATTSMPIIQQVYGYLFKMVLEVVWTGSVLNNVFGWFGLI